MRGVGQAVRPLLQLGEGDDDRVNAWWMLDHGRLVGLYGRADAQEIPMSRVSTIQPVK